MEKAIQKALVRWFLTTIYHTSHNIKLIAVQNENSRHETDMGVDNGHPDLYLAGCDNIHYLELKKKKGKLSDNQKKWNEWFDDNLSCDNITRDVAYGYEQAKEKITIWCNNLINGEI